MDCDVNYPISGEFEGKRDLITIERVNCIVFTIRQVVGDPVEEKHFMIKAVLLFGAMIGMAAFMLWEIMT